MCDERAEEGRHQGETLAVQGRSSVGLEWSREASDDDGGQSSLAGVKPPGGASSRSPAENEAHAEPGSSE